MNNSVINVKINAKDEYSYPIIIGKNILANANEIIKQHTKAKNFLIVSNQKVYDLHHDKLNIDNSHWFLIPDGEEFKNFETYNSILEKCFELKLERKDALIAFGGGIVGDITGFVASTYLRGIDFIQIPTTLLAQVDSSVGGKVAINNNYGKNLVGAFYQPKLVLSDTEVLKTLDARQFKTGLAEVIKYGFIEKNCNCETCYNFLEFLTQNRQQIFEQEENVMQKVVEICCVLKASVVFQDEKESGLRQILNFGHTYGHAVEKITNYNTFTHGEAVAIGMEFIFQKALKENLITKDYCEFAINLIKEYDLIPTNTCVLDVEKVLENMKYDKKVENGKIKFVIPINYARVDIMF